MAMGPYLTIARLAAAVRFTLRHVQRSEEHTSELQSQSNLVCRLLLEKKKMPLSIKFSPLRSSHSCVFPHVQATARATSPHYSHPILPTRRHFPQLCLVRPL